MEPQRVPRSIKERRNSLGVAPLKLCKLLFMVCMLFEYMSVEIRPTIPFHASDGALVAFPFLFIFILKSPAESCSLESTGGMIRRICEPLWETHPPAAADHSR